VSLTLTIDPHVHSEGSFDANYPVETLLERAVEAELDAIAVTDHDGIAESRRAAALAPEYGLLGIPGVEVSTAQGHLLALGVDERPPPGLSYADTVEVVQGWGGVAVAPHPFQRSRHGVRRQPLLGSGVDAVETFNACTFLGRRTRQAAAFASDRGLPAVGGSDAHLPGQVGLGVTDVTVDATVDDPTGVDVAAVLEAIRVGETTVRGRRTSMRGYVRKYATNARIKSAPAVRTTGRAAMVAAGLYGTRVVAGRMTGGSTFRADAPGPADPDHSHDS
jgi:predicted metal-dependent phosphoesterase TrpH